MTRLLLAMLLISACKGDPTDPTEPADADTDTDTDSDADTDTVIHTGDSGTTTSTTTTTAFDCSQVPASPLSYTQFSGPKGYHDLAFTPDGYVIGSDNSSLLKADYLGAISVLTPGTDWVQGMDWLPNGDLVVAHDGSDSLLRVTPYGGVSTLATDVGAYGVVVGPDNMVYTANYIVVHRIDPDTGQKTVLLRHPDLQPRVLNFSPDYSRLYIGTLQGSGAIYYVDLDQSLDPVGSPGVLATGVGTGSYHDGLGVDQCGNLYVPDYSTNDLWRVSPAGQVSRFVDFSFSTYGHGIKWGNGIGGWREDAIYLPQPYNNNNVVEIVIGVKSSAHAGFTWP